MAEEPYRDETPHIPGKHRGPRFTWNPAYEVTFFRSLCESVQLGLREGMTFKSGAWDRAAQALIDKHNAYANKGHLINKSDNARKKFRMWRSLREHPDFLYNPTTKTINGSEEAWRKHIEREPLSRSLKGRPFEYEDYYEILFPDVIGTGGAPKRITTRKRKTDTSMVGDTDHDQTMASSDGTPGPAMMILADATYGNSSSSTSTSNMASQQAHQLQLQAQAAHRQSTASTAPAPSPTMTQHHTQQSQRPTSTALPPRTSIASTSATLTPPEETAPHTRQRFLVPQDQPHPQPQSTYQPPPRPNTGPDKRRKGKADGYLNVHPPQPPPPPPLPLSVTHAPVHHHHQQPFSSPPSTDGILALAEALRKPSRPAYSEQAVEIFLRDFSDEDMDFQIKIADKMFAADENKAMVFVKMSVELRRHWVKKLREFHLNKQT